MLTGNFNQMASFSETKCLKILSSEEGVQELMKYTRQFLARIYPKGSRTSSTNYDPIPVFNIGCQIGGFSIFYPLSVTDFVFLENDSLLMRLILPILSIHILAQQMLVAIILTLHNCNNANRWIGRMDAMHFIPYEATNSMLI